MQTAHWTGAGALALASLLGAAACGSDVNTPSSGGSVSGAGGDGTGGQSTTTASTSGSGGAGSSCSAFSKKGCAPDEYCDYGGDTCGGLDESGTCTPRPTDCPPGDGAYCACDGTIYGSQCLAYAAGFDLSGGGTTCTPPMGMFACGEIFCLTGTEYCQRSTSDVGGRPDAYSCQNLPPECQGMTPPSCDCLKDQPCGDLCEITAPGGIQVTCPGG